MNKPDCQHGAGGTRKVTPFDPESGHGAAYHLRKVSSVFTIAPKNRGWSAYVVTIPQEYNLSESPTQTENRNRFWRSLGKRVANGSRISK